MKRRYTYLFAALTAGIAVYIKSESVLESTAAFVFMILYGGMVEFYQMLGELLERKFKA